METKEKPHLFSIGVVDRRGDPANDNKHSFCADNPWLFLIKRKKTSYYKKERCKLKVIVEINTFSSVKLIPIFLAI